MNTIDFKDVVVLGGDHYNPLWVVRSLGVAGYNPTLLVFKEHGNKSYISKSKYVKRFYILRNENEIIEKLLSFEFAQKTALIACSDVLARFLDTNRNILEKKYYVPGCGGECGLLSQWQDKEIQKEAAIKSGLRVIKGLSVNLNDNYQNIFDKIEYPCIIKPKNSSRASKSNFRICQDRNQLANCLLEIKDNCPDVLIQQYIHRDYEFNILGARCRSVNECVAPGGYYRTKMCTSLSNLGMPCYGYVKEEMHPGIDMDAWHKFIDMVDYDGLFSTEFLISGDKAYFLEMNLRDDGDLFYWTTGGVNLPAIWVSSLYGQDNVHLSRILIKQITYGMNEINYIKYQLHFKTLFENLKDWLKCDCYTIFNWRDLRPFLYKFIYAFLG